MRAKTLRVSAGAIFFLLALVLSAGVAHAVTRTLLTSHRRTPTPPRATRGARCATLQIQASTARNVYGAAWAANGHNFTTVEPLNSDGVGGTNLAEITAGTQPGWCVQTTAGCLQTTGTPPAVSLDDVAPPPTNRPPVLAAIGAKTVNEGVLLTFTATATDPDGNALTFSAGSLPTGATLTPAGAFSWTPSFTQGQTTPYSVTITVTDNGSPAASDFETFTITVGNVNRPPVLAPIGAKTGTEGQPLTFTATATDPDGNALTFSAGGLPTGATLTPAGAFSWTPATGQAGNYNVTITVTDTGGLIDSEIVTITVGNVNRPPVLAPIGAKTGTEGQLAHVHGHRDGSGRQRADVLGWGSAHRRDSDTGWGLQLDAHVRSGRHLQRHHHRDRQRKSGGKRL